MRTISDLPPERWDQIVENSLEGTFFHTYTWAKIVSDSYGFDIETKLFIFNDGSEVLFPLMKTHTRGGIFREFHSMPFSTYGGPLPSDIDDSKLAKILSTFRTSDSLSVIPNPLYFRTYWKGFEHTNFPTHILPLAEGFDYIWDKRFAGKVRNQCRKAEKEGYEIGVNNSLEAFKWFSDTYSEAAARRGEIPYPFSLYKAMQENAGERIKLWCAEKEETLVGALPALYGPRDVFYWSIAVEPAHIKNNLNNLLLKRVVEDACSRGYQYFNFGASSVGGRELESVAKYKESFGADRIEYPIYVREGLLYRASKKVYRILGFSRSSREGN